MFAKITSAGGDQVSIVDPDETLVIIEDKLEVKTLEDITWKSEEQLTVVESDEVIYFYTSTILWQRFKSGFIIRRDCIKKYFRSRRNT